MNATWASVCNVQRHGVHQDMASTRRTAHSPDREVRPIYCSEAVLFLLKRGPSDASLLTALPLPMRWSGQRMDQVTVMATEALATPTTLVAFTVNV